MTDNLLFEHSMPQNVVCLILLVNICCGGERQVLESARPQTMGKGIHDESSATGRNCSR